MAELSVDGVSPAALAERWGVPACHWRSEVTSTFDLLHELAARGAPAGTVVLADTQTAGRGREGRTWFSPSGGVWLGVLYRPRAGNAPPGVESIRLGLAVADAVDAVVGAPVMSLKWPNDVLLHGRKLAGVLGEARWQGETLQWLAAGIGINVANPIPETLRRTAIALAEVVPGVRRIDVLDRLIPLLLRLPDSPRLTALECERFAARDWLHGRALARPREGKAGGIDDDGALRIETGKGAGVLAVREGSVTLA
ncbi:MAG TPA: biotin--[acetyl-CoA-carboxylase] ligase [Gemmatimonadales bacterium]|nr:biotin--[acetyl-CoA-carboxylase] ligase [Gemmatimonadales bacterium]